MSHDQKFKRQPLSLDLSGERRAGYPQARKKQTQRVEMARKAADRLRENLAGKTWKPVPGYEEFYAVTTSGEIISFRYGRILKGFISGDYLTVTLCGDFGKIKKGIHILVALAFIGPKPHPKDEVNHKDGIKTNNASYNLEWTTRQGNQIHAIQTGLRATGEKSHLCTKLTEESVRQILALRGTASQQAIASQFGISQTYAGKLLRGKKWSKITTIT